MGLSIVQHRGAIHANTIPGSASSVVLTGAPTAGNLLIAFVGVNIGDASLTIDTSKWTVFEKVYSTTDSGGNLCHVGLYRYVQGGDTATLPAFATAGGTYWTDTVYEIGGVTGTWDTDLLFSMPIYKESANANFLPLVAPINALALAATASYNGNTNPSFSGSWTTDETHNNSSNFGSAAGAHRAITAGAAVDGAPTQGTSAPYSAILLLLCDGTYPTTPWVRHLALRALSSVQTAGTFTVPWTPKQGALLISALDWSNGGTANPTIGASWTEFASQIGSTNKMLILAYRYVQVGDTSALPALVTSGTTFSAQTVIELTGVSATFAAANVGNNYKNVQASGASMTTTADTTTAANQLALTFFANYNSSALGSIGGTGWMAAAWLNSTFYGTWLLGLQAFPSAASSVSSTLTPGLTSAYQAYIQTLWSNGTVAATAADLQRLARGLGRGVVRGAR